MANAHAARLRGWLAGWCIFGATIVQPHAGAHVHIVVDTSAVVAVVLDEPEKNSNEYLVVRIEELAKLPEKKLLEMMKKAKEKKDEFETGEIDEIKKKHYVK